MKFIKTEAIVIGQHSLPTKDKIIIFLTAPLGKIRVFAKGIKKITSRRLSHLDTGNLVKILLTQKNDLFYLRETELISGFSSLKQHKEKISYLYSFFFILNKILPENQKEEEVYALVKKFLIVLGKKEKIDQNIFSSYLNQLLIILGYSEKEENFFPLIKKIESIIDEKIPSFEYN